MKMEDFKRIINTPYEVKFGKSILHCSKKKEYFIFGGILYGYLYN